MRMQPADRDLAVGYDAAAGLCLQLCMAVSVHRKHAQVLCQITHAPFAVMHAWASWLPNAYMQPSIVSSDMPPARTGMQPVPAFRPSSIKPGACHPPENPHYGLSSP